MNTIRILGITYLLSGFLLVVIMVLINPISLLVDTLVIFGFNLITLGFLIWFLSINKEVNNHET